MEFRKAAPSVRTCGKIFSGQPERENSDPFGAPSEGGGNWTRDASGVVQIPEAARRIRNERRIAHDALCQAFATLPELADSGFAALAGLAMFEGRNLEEMERLALQILTQRASVAKPPDSTLRLEILYRQGFESGRRFAMPSPALFSTQQACLRGDARVLEETVFPLIKKSGGELMLEFCRGYAAVLQADDAGFPAAAGAWLRPWTRNNIDRARVFSPGGMAGEVVRLWQKRRISTPLDELFIEFRDVNLTPTDPFAAPSTASVTDSYVQALLQRGPDALRQFIHGMRDAWISPDAEMRRKLIAASQEEHKGRRPVAEKNAARYVTWLESLMNEHHSLVAVECALEDGLSNTLDWMRFSYAGGSALTAKEFMGIMRTTGFLPDAAGIGPLSAANGRLVEWTFTTALRFRSRGEAAQVNEVIELLGRHRPASFSTHLLQAQLVRSGVTTLLIDGKPVKLKVADENDATALRDAAFREVMLRHSADIAAMPLEDRRWLSQLLTTHQTGVMPPPGGDADLARAMAPLVQAEREARQMKADAMLAFKAWHEFEGNRQGDFNELLRFLRELAPEDLPRAIAVARHAQKLIHNSPENRRDISNRLPQTIEDRLILALGSVPELLGTTLLMAEETGLNHSMTWCGTLSSRIDEFLKDKGTAAHVFADTGFTADAAAFRDAFVDDDVAPTQIARIVAFLEKNPETGKLIQQNLTRSRSTFGTRLILALLRDAQEPGCLLRFIREEGEFSKLVPESAACVLALLKARLPDLDRRCAEEPDLMKALQPLVIADAGRLEAEVQQWMQTTSLKAVRVGEIEASRRAVRLLGRLVEVDKSRAVLLLDHMARLMAVEERAKHFGRAASPPHLTLVAQWLRSALVVPELYGEIMQRANECGAANNEWLQGCLDRFSDLRRWNIDRVMLLLGHLHVLAPAVTFDPHDLRSTEGESSLIEQWMQHWQKGEGPTGLADSLRSHEPQTFGTGLLLLLSEAQPSDKEISEFLSRHAGEIVATPVEQQKRLMDLFRRMGWTKYMAPPLPQPQAAPPP